MTRTVDVAEFAAQMAELLREAEAGETIVITREGRPAVHLQRAETTAEPAGAPGVGTTLWDALKDAPKARTAEEELIIDRKADLWRNDHFEFDPE
ncbi:type II toxin-antitoxin system prevent-host-death family antitoxin [Deinococcus sp. YIM 134068]|uniref:type II toxin-antitoxin system Phd/YefM family antitoxin n=1 Tax=Deinococcus lichenicola TaxID=3118910 RepID=UPI002F92EDBD